jgi:hypothetical protein
MQFKFLIIPTLLAFQVATAQNGTVTTVPSQGTSTTLASAFSTTFAPAETSPAPASPASGQTSYLDYKSIYETSTVEDEVKMAAERFKLTPSQQDMWLVAATDRRVVETQARTKLEGKVDNYEKDGIYRGLKSAQNTFYETITGYLTPTQKQEMETDRLILAEKQRRIAKLPPPPPPAPTVTVAPVDSTAIKAAENEKKTTKKSKKKKKPAAQ